MRTVDEKKRTEKAAKIVAAASQKFADKGFHQLSMSELCKSIGVSAGSMYSYFASKNDLIVACTEYHLSDVYEFSRLLESTPQPVDLLLDAAIHELKTPDTLLDVEIYAESLRNSKVKDCLMKADAAFSDALKHQLHQHCPNKIQTEIEAYTLLLMTLYDGLRTRAFLNPKSNHKAFLTTLRLTLENIFTDEKHTSS